MKKIDLLDKNGKKIEDITLSKTIFEIEPNKKVIKDAIVLTQSSLRQGTHKTKTRAEVRGGGRKPWRQKGTGRARHGSIRSNIWVGGGVVFGPTPNKNYLKKMNKKESLLALLSSLSIKKDDLIVVDNLKLESSKVKDFVKVLEALKLKEVKTLIITDELDENIILASRNLNNINLIEVSEINVFDLINSDKVLITKDALKEIEEAFGDER